jgi:Ala-tRNA(Pro) deacylase
MDSAHASQPTEDTYERLLEFLDQQGVQYRLIDHQPEGRTELVSEMRGHDIRHAAKCMILLVKQGKRVTRYVLAVVPGNAKVDFQAIKSLLQATYVSFASPETAVLLSGAPTGAVLPFTFHSSLDLIVDPSLLDSDEIYFNAARLDRSMALDTKAYVALSKPRLASIAVVA